MGTIYLILSTDYISIKENINNILKENKVDKDALINYDLSTSSLSSAIEDLDTYNFLVEKKVVVCENPVFLNSTKKDEYEKDNEIFIKYF